MRREVSDLFGVRVIESPLLPLYPDHKEDARRIVRRGLYAELPWLKGDPGPAPGVPTIAFLIPVGGFPVMVVDSSLTRALRHTAGA